jgi:hypothetical protein
MPIHSVGIDLGKTTFHLALGAVGMKPSAVRAFVRNDQLPGTRLNSTLRPRNECLMRTGDLAAATQALRRHQSPNRSASSCSLRALGRLMRRNLSGDPLDVKTPFQISRERFKCMRGASEVLD